jgi:calcium/calmodulin-dependent protein kinase I
MHSKRLVHRDLKFDNILVRIDKGECRFVVADFGLCAWVDQEVQYFYKCGTVGYLPPEIFSVEDKKIVPTFKFDVFSLGCMLHTLLLGRSPFSSSDLKIMSQKNRDCQLNFNSLKYNFLSFT